MLDCFKSPSKMLKILPKHFNKALKHILLAQSFVQYTIIKQLHNKEFPTGTAEYCTKLNQISHFKIHLLSRLFQCKPVHCHKMHKFTEMLCMQLVINRLYNWASCMSRLVVIKGWAVKDDRFMAVAIRFHFATSVESFLILCCDKEVT